MCICHVHMSACKDQKRVTASSELMDMDTGNQTWGPLKEQQVLLAVASSLQPSIKEFKSGLTYVSCSCATLSKNCNEDYLYNLVNPFLRTKISLPWRSSLIKQLVSWWIGLTHFNGQFSFSFSISVSRLPLCVSVCTSLSRRYLSFLTHLWKVLSYSLKFFLYNEETVVIRVYEKSTWHMHC